MVKIAFPTSKWGKDQINNPQNACVETVKNILSVAATINAKANRKIILISSIGVERKKQFPFSILNSYGVLDAKLESEMIVKEYCSKFNWESIIIRPGRLVGAPFTNFDLAKLLNISQGLNKAIKVSNVDDVSGDLERADVARIVKILLNRPFQSKRQLTFSVVNANGISPSDSEIEYLFYN